jgi:cell division protein FtsA
MHTRTTVGIDIGTHQIKVVVAAQKKNVAKPVVLGTGYAHSRGIRQGYVIQKQDLLKTLETAIAAAEHASRIAIREAYVSVGGVGLEEFRSRAEVMVSRADGVVSELDTKHALEESERKITNRLVNRKIIHSIPLTYTLDGEKIISNRPLGMKGVRLEVESLFITALEQHLDDLIGTVEAAGISVIDVMASPLAGSFVTLTKPQKIAGVVLANLGAETISIAVFENDIPISVRVFPVGVNDITNDIALGLCVSLEEAEEAKRSYRGTTERMKNGAKKQLETIIQNRVKDMFLLIDAHLKRIGKNELLPAGIVISGGGSGIATINDLAKATLKLPSRSATLSAPQHSSIKDATWAVAYGLCLWGITNKREAKATRALQERFAQILHWLKQFLP